MMHVKNVIKSQLTHEWFEIVEGSTDHLLEVMYRLLIEIIFSAWGASVGAKSNFRDKYWKRLWIGEWYQQTTNGKLGSGS
jgi:hypothetical protein